MNFGNFIIKGNKIAFLIIILSFFTSISLSNYFINKYDRYEVSTDELETHAMIKSDLVDYWSNAKIFKKDLNDNKNFISSGNEMWRSYLHERLIGLYFYVTDKKMFDNWDIEKYVSLLFSSEDKIRIANGNKYLFLVLQSLLYYFILLFLYLKIINYYPKKHCICTILFLSVNPNIFTFHSSFFTESIFYSLQLLFIYFLIDFSYKKKNNFLIGILLGIMFMQKPFVIYFVIPLLVFYLYIFKKKSFLPIITLMSGYLLILIFIGVSNYQRIGKFYIMPGITNYGLYYYVSDNIVSKGNNISQNEASKIRARSKDEWIKKNNINLNKETDRLKLYKYFKKYANQSIIENPIISIKYHLYKSLQTGILNPIYIFHVYKYEFRKRPYYYFEESYKRKWLKINLSYSIFIYFFVILGFFYSLKEKERLNFKFTLIIVLFSVYLLAVGGWVGVSRIWNPSLIFFSFLFSNGLLGIFEKRNKLKQTG